MASIKAALQEVLDEIQTIGTFANNLANLDHTAAINNNIRVISEQKIHDLLVETAIVAIESIEEYRFAPLMDRFIANISNPNHVYVSTDLSYIRVLDKKLIGNEQDLISGLYNSGADPQARSIVWKYGIYKPEREGLELAPKYEKYPSYTEVVNKRLDDWGDKAPYWIFINSGTVGGKGGGTPYPTFSGTNFVEKVMGTAKSIIKQVSSGVERELVSNIERGIEEQLISTEKVLRVEFGRIELGRTAEGRRIQAAVKETKEGTYYQLVIGGRFGKKVTIEQILAM